MSAPGHRMAAHTPHSSLSAPPRLKPEHVTRRGTAPPDSCWKDFKRSAWSLLGEMARDSNWLRKPVCTWTSPVSCTGAGGRWGRGCGSLEWRRDGLNVSTQGAAQRLHTRAPLGKHAARTLTTLTNRITKANVSCPFKPPHRGQAVFPPLGLLIMRHQIFDGADESGDLSMGPQQAQQGKALSSESAGAVHGAGAGAASRTLHMCRNVAIDCISVTARQCLAVSPQPAHLTWMPAASVTQSRCSSVYLPTNLCAGV